MLKNKQIDYILVYSTACIKYYGRKTLKSQWLFGRIKGEINVEKQNKLCYSKKR